MDYTALDQLFLNAGTGKYGLHALKTELSQPQHNTVEDLAKYVFYSLTLCFACICVTSVKWANMTRNITYFVIYILILKINIYFQWFKQNYQQGTKYELFDVRMFGKSVLVLYLDYFQVLKPTLN